MNSQMQSAVMKVEQAVFASSDRGNVKGYQLVAQSAGIDSAQAIEITRWAPTRLPSDASDHWTISAWTLPDNTVAVTRTVYGGPEYSERGGIQVVTLFLLLGGEQFRAYDYNAISVVKTAMALGYLRLPFDMPRRELPRVGLPGHPIIESARIGYQANTNPYRALLDRISAALADSKRVAVVGLSDQIGAVEELISRMTFAQRRNFSFTTGLSPSIRRPLQAHFYRRPDMARQRTLEAEDIVCFHANALQSK